MALAGCQPKMTFIVVGAIITLLLMVQMTRSPPEPIRRFSSNLSTKLKLIDGAAESKDAAMNRTLGFEKILAINLPERSDKRDAMTLAASLTNLTIDFSDGVKGESVPDKALPLGQTDRHMNENMFGSWRAHMNAIRSVVENGWSSALILEDDSDWDIRIKGQVANMAVGTRFLQDVKEGDRTHSPYGDDWDVLWIGHCVDEIDESNPRTFVIQDDPSATEYTQLYHPFNKIPKWISEHPKHSRIVHTSGAAICTFAYAVSYRGAQRILYNLAVKELQGLFDNALAWMCRDHNRGVKCLGVYPPVFHQHRAAGMAGKNSDNQDTTPELQKESTDCLQWPTKMNFEKLLMGRTDFEDQYPDKPDEPEKPAQ